MTQLATTTPLEGIVLHLGTYGDTHRVVEALTLQQGRISLMARGARASKKRFGGVLEVFSTLQLHLAPGRGSLPTLQAADVVDGRYPIRQNLDAIGRASALCACVRRIVPEHQTSHDVYVLLRHALDCLARGEVNRAAAAYPRLASVSGILPDLKACGACGRGGVALGAAAGHGALVCARCAPRRLTLSEPALAGLHGEPLRDAESAAAVEGAVMTWVAAHTGRAWRGLEHFVKLP